MHQIGQEELAAVDRVIASGNPFRYRDSSECACFETRFSKYLGTRHVCLTASGTAALTAALGALGIGPGDEVIVPAHTYMATAIAVLAVGAIPVIVDIDESITLDPQALEDAVGPRTRAVIPVHMWGVVCDMAAIMRVARRRKLLVVEDACQCAGGEFRGRMCGSIGDAGAFSFNYFKNMTCGEGGAAVTNRSAVFKRIQCMTDCCNYFWSGRRKDFIPFAANGSRASEFEGAILNVQLDRLPGIVRSLRSVKRRIVDALAKDRVPYAPARSPDGECATNILFQWPTAAQAATFVKLAGGGIAANTGRHTYTEWDPVLKHQGAHHPAMNPFLLAANKGCRMRYSKDMCPRSLAILGRTVLYGLRYDMKPAETGATVEKIRAAARETFV